MSDRNMQELIKLFIAQQQQQQQQAQQPRPQHQGTAGDLDLNALEHFQRQLRAVSGYLQASNPPQQFPHNNGTRPSAPAQALQPSQGNDQYQQQQHLLQSAKLLASVNPSLAAEAVQHALSLFPQSMSVGTNQQPQQHVSLNACSCLILYHFD